MSLPQLLAPPGTPVFLADGHAIDEDSVHDDVPFATGHSRTRRVFSVNQRVVSVRWFLEPDLMRSVIDWYEDTLRAGSLPFSARVANQGDFGLLYWEARWISIEFEMQHLERGIVSGLLFLIGEPSAISPETGSLSMEVGAALVGVPAPVVVERGLRMELIVALLQVASPATSSSSSSSSGA